MGEEAASNKPSDNALTQQRIPGWFPIMTPCKVISWFFVLGAFFLIVGIIFFVLNGTVTHIEKYYYESQTDNQNVFDIDLTSDLKQPIYVHYTLSNFYQNHAKFVKTQNNLIAPSLFNDTFVILDPNGNQLSIDRSNLATSFDRSRKDMNNCSEELIVWSKIAPLPTFRKLYGVIRKDLPKGKYTVQVASNYPMPTYSKKAFNILTVSGFGGRSPYTPVVYTATGGVCLILAVVFLLIQLFSPRPIGKYHPKFGSDLADTSILSDMGDTAVATIPAHLLSTDAFEEYLRNENAV
ncbi:putative cell cycle control protein [Monocercomonoides exilis]|uniref:putative cell cycle control protein n=1 Tax=Monocercomonoides exilis TaxID=2049356 RepID=UPI00355A245C|nr:putative cell cycle control protein [Monocercomonoides exilis]|eukprot:MONOS_10138.1-p1 / transcript=MONOS_10138.1 / gene=MONOS_10138 / organism=Monocercomonoides_exilis_PA203 / gene_product=cell cycle control protein / transcript_product=cell cycle control protein / location=Mono_scaffold00448:7114-8456(-) / protein_length=293 / sequence_SO=supercontig / SO=protein_coding / is_pseudo=false